MSRQHAIESAGRRLAGDGVIERCGEAVDVSPRPLLRRRHLLGGSIARGEDCRQRRRAPRYCRPRGAEVDQGRIAGAIEQDIGRLDVAVQEAGGVHLLQSIEQWPQDAVDLGGRQGPLLFQPMLERLAAQQLHDDVGRAVGLEEVEDPDDGWCVLQAGERPALGHEALATPGKIRRRIGRTRQHRRAVLAHGERQRQVFLDGDLTVELAVVGAVGDPETTLPENGDDLIASDRSSRRQRDEIDRRSLRPVTGGLVRRVAHEPPARSKRLAILLRVGAGRPLSCARRRPPPRIRR